MALDDEGEGYFTSYVLDDFLVYRNPDIKPFAREVAEDEKMEKKVVDRGRKGQGEYELPSAVYISSGVTNLRTFSRLPPPRPRVQKLILTVFSGGRNFTIWRKGRGATWSCL